MSNYLLFTLILKTINPPLFFIIVVALPCAYLALASLFNKKKEGKEEQFCALVKETIFFIFGFLSPSLSLSLHAAHKLNPFLSFDWG